MPCVVEAFFGFYEHIIDINLHGFAYQGSKYLCHHSLIRCPCVFQTKRHYVVAIQSVGRDEGCFLRVRRVHRNLMVSGEGVQKRQNVMPSYCINNLIYTWQGEAIFGTHFIDISVVYTYTPLTTFFGMTTTLASHLGYFTSFIKLGTRRLSTSV